MTNNDELKNFREINAKLEQEFLCLPPYNSINGAFISKCVENIKLKKEIKYDITSEVIYPYRRAYQMVYRYRELSIFKPVLQVIEFATLAYYEGNQICTYLSLLPVIETLMREWQQEQPEVQFSNIKNFTTGINKKIKKEFPEGPLLNDWLHTYLEYLNYIITEVLYKSDKGYRTKNFHEIFNRNASLHKLSGISDMETTYLNNIRVFLIIDVIAEIYLISNYDKYEILQSNLDLNYNPELLNLYFEFYKSRFFYGLEFSNTNVINNIFLKEILTEEEINNTKQHIAEMNKALELIKKARN